MSNGTNLAQPQQEFDRLIRKGPQETDKAQVVTSPGAMAAVWAVKVKSLSSYNVYNVRAVELGEPGAVPAEIGTETQAVNLAESFTQNGQLASGTFVVMSRVGDKNVFYAPV
jgi:hypothetical protein